MYASPRRILPFKLDFVSRAVRAIKFLAVAVKGYQMLQEEAVMAECPVCGGTVNLGEDTVEGELIPCGECGSELEVTSVNPFTLAEAPKEEEDWGE